MNLIHMSYPIKALRLQSYVFEVFFRCLGGVWSSRSPVRRYEGRLFGVWRKNHRWRTIGPNPFTTIGPVQLLHLGGGNARDGDGVQRAAFFWAIGTHEEIRLLPFLGYYTCSHTGVLNGG